MLSLRESEGWQVGAVEVNATVDRLLQLATGFRVDGPEGYLGVLAGVPHAGNPPRPLVLVVRGSETMRFVSLARVAVVLPRARRIVLWPRSRR